MAGVMREPRTRVMISVEVSWEDQSGARRAVTARMENKSDGGACIRVDTPVVVGSKLGIRCRWDQFSGTAKYCVGDDGSFLVGIQRDTRASTIIGQLVSTVVPLRGEVKNSDPPASAAKLQNLQEPRKSKPSGVAPAEPKMQKEKEAIVHAAGPAVAMPPLGTRDKMESSRSPQALDGPRTIDLATTQLSEEKETAKSKKRKHMRRNWFGMAQSAKDVPGGNETANGDNGIRPPKPAPAERISADPAREDAPGFPVELMSVEDIYSTSGIRVPKKNYGINKVVEMLRSEHVRDLPNEMKRAAVLMALDAAGIPVEEVLRDAKARQDALDSYEAERKKQMEAEWARKAKENAEIMAELEAAKLHHMACINRNLDRIAREKTTFNDWLAVKQQESQNITEAAALCLKSIALEPAAVAPSAASAAEPAAVPASVSSTADSREKTPH